MRVALGCAALASAIALVGTAGAQTGAVAVGSRADVSCAGAVSWTRAKSMIGRVATIKGPVAGAFHAASSNGSPTFLNIGADYPSSRRFTVVIWGRDRWKFGSPERRYNGKTICVRGLIKPYQGVAEVFATSPSQLRVA